MGKEILTFGNIEIEKHKFHQRKNPIWINDVEINIIVVSSMFPSSKKGFKYFIGYKDIKKVRSLCIMLPNIREYIRDFDETKYMSFTIKNEELLERYNEIWNKASNSSRRGFDIETVWNEQ